MCLGLRGARNRHLNGVGGPGKVFASVRALGGIWSPPMHFPIITCIRAGDSARLLGAAAAQGAQLVTTAKDYVKLPGRCGRQAWWLQCACTGTMKRRWSGCWDE